MAKKITEAEIKAKQKELELQKQSMERHAQINKLAEERLAVLKNCNCEEYSELKEIIEKK